MRFRNLTFHALWLHQQMHNSGCSPAVWIAPAVIGFVDVTHCNDKVRVFVVSALIVGSNTGVRQNQGWRRWRWGLPRCTHHRRSKDAATVHATDVWAVKGCPIRQNSRNVGCHPWTWIQPRPGIHAAPATRRASETVHCVRVRPMIDLARGAGP